MRRLGCNAMAVGVMLAAIAAPIPAHTGGSPLKISHHVQATPLKVLEPRMPWVLHPKPAPRKVIRKIVRKPQQVVSRSIERAPVPVAVAVGDPQQIAAEMLAERGQSSQLGCLIAMWNRESGWRVTAANPSSGAYGIPQALPGSKMASAGPDWQWNPATQIRWGLDYIASRYGSPCGAWSVWQSRGWY